MLQSGNSGVWEQWVPIWTALVRAFGISPEGAKQAQCLSRWLSREGLFHISTTQALHCFNILGSPCALTEVAEKRPYSPLSWLTPWMVSVGQASMVPLTYRWQRRQTLSMSWHLERETGVLGLLEKWHVGTHLGKQGRQGLHAEVSPCCFSRKTSIFPLSCQKCIETSISNRPFWTIWWEGNVRPTCDCHSNDGKREAFLWLPEQLCLNGEQKTENPQKRRGKTSTTLDTCSEKVLGYFSKQVPLSLGHFQGYVGMSSGERASSVNRNSLVPYEACATSVLWSEGKPTHRLPLPYRSNTIVATLATSRFLDCRLASSKEALTVSMKKALKAAFLT